MAVHVVLAELVGKRVDKEVFETVLVFVAVIVPRGDLDPVTVRVELGDGFVDRVLEGERLTVLVAVAVGDSMTIPAKYRAFV